MASREEVAVCLSQVIEREFEGGGIVVRADGQRLVVFKPRTPASAVYLGVALIRSLEGDAQEIAREIWQNTRARVAEAIKCLPDNMRVVPTVRR